MGDIAIQSATPSIGDALPRAGRRDAFNGWFVTHEVAWELAMAALAIVYVALGFIVDSVDPGERPEIEAVEVGADRPLRPRIRLAHPRRPESACLPARPLDRRRRSRAANPNRPVASAPSAASAGASLRGHLPSRPARQRSSSTQGLRLALARLAWRNGPLLGLDVH